jgi:hypothetical protein
MRNFWTILADIVCFMGGSALTVGGLVNFKIYRSLRRYGGDYANWTDPAYGYGPDQIAEIAAGISLVVLGFLIRSWTKKQANDFIK